MPTGHPEKESHVYPVLPPHQDQRRALRLARPQKRTLLLLPRRAQARHRPLHRSSRPDGHRSPPHVPAGRLAAPAHRRRTRPALLPSSTSRSWKTATPFRSHSRSSSPPWRKTASTPSLPRCSSTASRSPAPTPTKLDPAPKRNPGKVSPHHPRRSQRQPHRPRRRSRRPPRSRRTTSAPAPPPATGICCRPKRRKGTASRPRPKPLPPRPLPPSSPSLIPPAASFVRGLIRPQHHSSAESEGSLLPSQPRASLRANHCFRTGSRSAATFRIEPRLIPQAAYPLIGAERMN